MNMNLIPAVSCWCEILNTAKCKAAQASGQEGRQYSTETNL